MNYSFLQTTDEELEHFISIEKGHAVTSALYRSAVKELKRRDEKRRRWIEESTFDNAAP